jgi:hypothetical protein
MLDLDPKAMEVAANQSFSLSVVPEKESAHSSGCLAALRCHITSWPALDQLSLNMNLRSRGLDWVEGLFTRQYIQALKAAN